MKNNLEKESKFIVDNLTSQQAFDIVFSRSHEKVFNDLLIKQLKLKTRNVPGLRTKYGLIPDASFIYKDNLIIIEIGHNGIYQYPELSINKAYTDIKKWDSTDSKVYTIQIIEDVIQLDSVHVDSSKYYNKTSWGEGIKYFLHNRSLVTNKVKYIKDEYKNIDVNRYYYSSKVYNYLSTEIQFHILVTGPHDGNQSTSSYIKSKLPYLK